MEATAPRIGLKMIEAISEQMNDLASQKKPRDNNEYLSAMIAFETRICEPRCGFICINYEGKKYIYPHTWLISQGKMIDIGIYKQRAPNSTEWFVKPGIILDEVKYFTPMDDVDSKKIILNKIPLYFYDKKSIDHFLYNEHIIEDYEFDMMQVRLSSRQKMKALIRTEGEINYKKFARRAES